jgi:hypothetical protein
VENKNLPGFLNHIMVKVKVKKSRDRPGVAKSVQRGLGSKISMTFDT